MSPFTIAANASGKLPTGSPPSVVMRSRISGCWTIFATSSRMRTTMSRGVPAGAKRPNHATVSKPGSVSATAGRSGTSGERWAVVTASARTRPALMWPIAGGRLPMNIATCPPITSVSAGVAPLYGMCAMSTPAIDLNSSAVKCAELPLPPEP